MIRSATYHARAVGEQAVSGKLIVRILNDNAITGFRSTRSRPWRLLGATDHQNVRSIANNSRRRPDSPQLRAQGR